MKLSRIIKSKFKDQRGAVAVIVAVSMVMLIGFLALAIDVGYLYATKNELQNVADSAALAAASELGNFYNNSAVPFGSGNRSLIEDAAQSVVGSGKNTAGGENISIDSDDIFINNLKDVKDAFPTYRFNTNNYTAPDAVRVIARRDSFVNDQISTFFAKIFNIDSLPVTADATAALTGPAKIELGGLPIPIGINKSWMSTRPCRENLTLYPSSDDVCAAWHAYTGSNYSPDAGNNNGIPDLLDDIRTFDYESPETTAGVTEFVFTNGNMTRLFNGGFLENLFDDRRVRNDGIHDMDDNDATWTLTVPVFDDSSLARCNPTGPLVIVGFATITITQIVGPPQKEVKATILCEEVRPVRGEGGVSYGTTGVLPGLVE